MYNYEVNKPFKDNESNVKNLLIKINSNQELDSEILKEIEELELTSYWSDDSCKHWSFDTKLSNGLWLENIFYNNELTVATASIF